MKCEIFGSSQQTLINLYHDKIHECNRIIKSNEEIKRSLEDLRKKDQRYNNITSESLDADTEYRLSLRKSYVYKLKDARNGFIGE